MLLAAGAVLGVIGGIAMLRLAIVRTFLRYLSVAPPVFGVLFVFSSAVTPVIFVSDPSAAHVKVAHPKRVVMIVMDEFPTASLLDGNGQLDATLFPNLASLAKGATWYRNDTTVGPHTTMAVPAILTGKFPNGEPVPIASEFPQNLFTLLGGSYHMNVHESATRLCPVALCGAGADSAKANDGLDGLLDEGVNQWETFASPERTTKQDALLHQSPYVENAFDSSQSFVNSLKPSAKSQLDFLHVLLPHTPWHYLGPGQDYVTLAGQGVRAGTWKDSWNAAFGRERHLLQVQTADYVVGQVVKKLKQHRRLRRLDDHRHRGPRRRLPARRPEPRRVAAELPGDHVDAAAREGAGPDRRGARRPARPTRPTSCRRSPQTLERQDPVEAGRDARCSARREWTGCGASRTGRSTSSGRRTARTTSSSTDRPASPGC